MKKRVLFLCTANSCRSQMAEGIVNYYLGNQIEAFSAGITPTFVHPRAIEALLEIGIDVSGNRSKSMTEFEGQQFDYVITLCDSANEQCPLFFGGVKKIHMGFDDPAAATGTDEEIMAAFRRVRDAIKDQLLHFFQTNAERR
jgi:arsenate reductase (thioredoxin)